jgi:hypothetical protein
LRQEPGEITGRLHFHFLIAGLPLYAVQDATCMSIKAQWKKLGGGMARRAAGGSTPNIRCCVDVARDERAFCGMEPTWS